jgi:hypothetical protein
MHSFYIIGCKYSLPPVAILTAVPVFKPSRLHSTILLLAIFHEKPEPMARWGGLSKWFVP